MKNELPHSNVCTRLQKSDINGIGVFAIIPIKKDSPIFGDDDAEMIWVKEREIANLHPKLQEMYEDFCVKIGDEYGCPSNFNKLTISWYLNNSDTPNVYCDKDYKFFALRDIEEGEELTANYSTYSDDYKIDS